MSIHINRHYLETSSLNFDRDRILDHCSEVILSLGSGNLYEIGYGFSPEEIQRRFVCDQRKGEIYLLSTTNSQSEAEKMVMELNRGFGLQRHNFYKQRHVKVSIYYIYAFIKRGRLL
jgi:hypothetical protein